MKCDNCGQIYVAKDEKRTFASRVKLDQAVVAPPAVPTQPKVSGAREWDVVVPLQVSAITGAILALLLMVATVPWRWAVGIGLVLVLLVWFVTLILFLWFRFEKIRDLGYVIEDKTGLDLNRDGEVGKPGVLVLDGRGGGKKRPRSWDRLAAEDMAEDVMAFALRLWELEQRGAPTGQKAMRGFELPSEFKVNDGIHATLVGHLKKLNLGYSASSGFVLYTFSNAAELETTLRQKVQVWDA
jgi:MFS family permease